MPRKSLGISEPSGRRAGRRRRLTARWAKKKKRDWRRRFQRLSTGLGLVWCPFRSHVIQGAAAVAA